MIGLCKDGLFYLGVLKKGVCVGYKGVKMWYGVLGVVVVSVLVVVLVMVVFVVLVLGVVGVKSVVMMVVVLGGGVGKVWVNDSMKVYYCLIDKYYGKMKYGSYMLEVDVKVKGYYVLYGKVCL